MTDAATPDAETLIGAGASTQAEPRDSAASGTVVAPTGLDAVGRPWPPFAHGSEAEMARILDFYGVRWEYEPRTFPILWNLDGDVVESFSPDFYLPDLDLFLELTTLKQRLVRKKNRKLRRLRELYPDIRIKLFYARDFRAMMLKYGRLALADSLSGALGQVMPDRSREPDLDPVAGGSELRPADRPTTHLGGSPAADSPAGRPATGEPSEPRRRAGERANAEPAAPARPNASRSRRRRAAAAARAAAREAAETSAPRAMRHIQEERGSQ